MNDKLCAAYREEAAELLADLEVTLLELENSGEDAELVARAFRALHTIKGSGAMFGFDAIASFTHELETAFDSVREGRLQLTPELIGIALDARDHIQQLLDAAPADAEQLAASGRLILNHLRDRCTPLPAHAPAPPSDHPAVEDSAAASSDTDQSELVTFRIRIIPAASVFLNGTNLILLLRELAELGDLSLVAQTDQIPELADFNPEECLVHWDAVLTTSASENAIRDIFIFVEDQVDLLIQQIETAEPQRLGQIMAARGDLNEAQVESVISQRPRIGDLLVEAGVVAPGQVEAAVMEQRHVSLQAKKRTPTEAASTLRVPAAKLDSLVNFVGELVTVQARLSGFAAASGSAEIASIAEEIERLSELLRESTMSIRMLPIRETFTRFKRLVRDLATDLHKHVELVTEGNETELDKTVIEQLSDPLLHLVRNAIDHGIESPAERQRRGKPPVGRIQLRASYSGAFVLVSVSDDGAGLNCDAIRARAIDRGLIAADAVLTEQEIYHLTFAPGFSTAATVTEISGRGVGMDVVQRGLDALRGSVAITSKLGAGTVITLKIPLTLAIIDGLLVEAAGSYYVVPLSNISECIEFVRDPNVSRRHSLVNVRGQLVPYVVLRERFALTGQPPPIEQAIIAETNDGRFGFVVDRVIGDHHTVIKKLGTLYRQVDEVSGATIMGDGSVALVLDVEKLAAGVIRESQRPRAFGPQLTH
ncbi:MAG: chemotaxis protein CheA [Acidobacteria bacterium]|nr:chemotaxis protein CheA [Acidobacteriota bacterium]